MLLYTLALLNINLAPLTHNTECWNEIHDLSYTIFTLMYRKSALYNYSINSKFILSMNKPLRG